MATDTKPTQDSKSATAKPAPVDSPPEARQAVDKDMRPLYQEVARLSATLGLARKACYAGMPEKAQDALELLEMQLPAARKLAGILIPYDV